MARVASRPMPRSSSAGAPPRAVTAAGARGARALPAALWLAAALISGFTMRRYLEPFDEGLLLQGASRIADGQWPYRDFGWPYGPGQPVVVAGLSAVFDPSVVWWRLLRVAADATAALAVWGLVRRPAGERWALAAWLAASVTVAQPTSANPFPVALAFALCAVLAAARGRPVPAGLLAALAAFWRPDLGAVAGIAAVAALLARGGGAPQARAADRAGTVHGASPGRPWRALLAAAAAVLGAVVLYLPFAIAAGPGRLWDELVGIAAGDGDLWRLPFPLAYDGPLRGWPPSALTEDLKDVLGFHLPLAGLVLAAAGVPMRGARIALAAALAVLALAGTANRLSALLLPPALEPVTLAGVPGIRVPPAEAAALPRMVERVQSIVPPGEPIYVAPRRSDLVTISDPLVHFLVRRPNVLARDVSVQALPEEQARIVAALRRERPRAVVRWTDPASSRPEPNSRGRPSGSRALDAYLASAYRLDARYGAYDVLVPRDR